MDTQAFLIEILGKSLVGNRCNRRKTVLGEASLDRPWIDTALDTCMLSGRHEEPRE